MINLENANQNKKGKQENRIRPVDWHLRLTEEEAAELGRLVFLSGQSRRDYILELARHGVIIDVTPIVRELYKQGVNLNQIAHQLNAGSNLNDQEILNIINEVRREWQSLRSAISTLLSKP